MNSVHEWYVPRDRWVPELGYLLAVKPERLDELVSEVQIYSLASVSIPVVPDAIRRQPLLCFITTRRGAITHVMRAEIRYLAESGRHRLDVSWGGQLPRPISIARVQRLLRGPHAWRAKNVLEKGGHLTASAFQTTMEAVRNLDAEVFEAVDRLIVRRSPTPPDAPLRTQENWAYQRDAIATALQIAGMDGIDLAITPQLPAHAAPGVRSVFDSDADVVMIENTLLLRDLDAADTDWQYIRRQHYPAKTYRTGDTTLTIVLANTFDLEHQLGVDLIYVNESLKSVVFVQYKMFRGIQGEEGYRPDGQLDIEIARMDAAMATLSEIEEDGSCEGYRFGSDPFFMKFCKKLLSHDGPGTTSAFYVPLGYWKRLADSDAARGVRDGRVVHEHSFGRRYFTHTHFVEMVERGWIGTSTLQTSVLVPYLKAAIEGQRGVVLAVQSQEPSSSQ